MSSPTFFGEGSSPRVTDTRWRILQKILGATIDLGGVATTNPVYTGAAPPAAPDFPLQGALFTPDADGAPLQKWIPGTGWVVI